MRWLPAESPALKVFVPLKVLEPFCVASVEGRRAALTVEELALMAVTTLSPAAALTPEAVVAVVAVEALPLSVAVMVPAKKLPEASRLTMAPAVFASAAALAAFAPEATLAALAPPTEETTVADCVPVTSPARLPLKFVALVAVVAVEALPLSVAVMTPAEKLPLASRLTIAPTVLA